MVPDYFPFCSHPDSLGCNSRHPFGWKRRYFGRGRHQFLIPALIYYSISSFRFPHPFYRGIRLAWLCVRSFTIEKECVGIQPDSWHRVVIMAPATILYQGYLSVRPGVWVTGFLVIYNRYRTFVIFIYVDL